jgi:hypothetical protein
LPRIATAAPAPRGAFAERASSAARAFSASSGKLPRSASTSSPVGTAPQVLVLVDGPEALALLKRGAAGALEEELQRGALLAARAKPLIPATSCSAGRRKRFIGKAVIPLPLRLISLRLAQAPIQAGRSSSLLFFRSTTCNPVSAWSASGSAWSLLPDTSSISSVSPKRASASGSAVSSSPTRLSARTCPLLCHTRAARCRSTRSTSASSPAAIFSLRISSKLLIMSFSGQVDVVFMGCRASQGLVLEAVGRYRGPASQKRGRRAPIRDQSASRRYPDGASPGNRAASERQATPWRSESPRGRAVARA